MSDPIGEAAAASGRRGARVVRVDGPLVEVADLRSAAMLEVLELGPGHLPAEAVSVSSSGHVTAQAYEYTGGLRVGDEAVGLGHPLSARLGPHLLGNIFDGLLRPLGDAPAWLAPGELRTASPAGGHWRFWPRASVGTLVQPGALLGIVPTRAGFEHRVIVPPGTRGTITWLAEEGEVGDDEGVADIGGRRVRLSEMWPVRVARPLGERLVPSAPLLTGQRVVDLLFPVAKGSTVAVPGGFGTGKTVMLQQILKWCDADVIVFVGCGERGNELADALTELRELGDAGGSSKLLDRTIVIANTSNMPVMAREASIYSGMTVAEYYRDMGYDAVLLADSTSRWAEALREFSSRAGELPAEEGYPAGLASAIAAFYERSGAVRTLGGRTGSVTVMGAVSPPGGDMTEPVTAHTERFVRCVWSLDRDLAYARHYPAITWRRSFSRDATAIAAWHGSAGRVSWADNRSRAVALLAEADRLAPVVELVGLAALPARERMTLLSARLVREGVLQQSALSSNDAWCGAEKQAALLDLVLALQHRCCSLVDGGVPASVVEEVDLSAATRARDDFPPDDAASVRSRRDELLAALEALR